MASATRCDGATKRSHNVGTKGRDSHPGLFFPSDLRQTIKSCHNKTRQELKWGAMGSGHNEPTPEIDWDEWSRVVEAAQDPRHRGAVQKFLAQADLSAEVPAVLDEKVLAPRRSKGATGEECAYLLCNLGFDALVAGTKGICGVRDGLRAAGGTTCARYA